MVAVGLSEKGGHDPRPQKWARSEGFNVAVIRALRLLRAVIYQCYRFPGFSPWVEYRYATEKFYHLEVLQWAGARTVSGMKRHAFSPQRMIVQWGRSQICHWNSDAYAYAASNDYLLGSVTVGMECKKQQELKSQNMGGLNCCYYWFFSNWFLFMPHTFKYVYVRTYIRKT